MVGCTKVPPGAYLAFAVDDVERALAAIVEAGGSAVGEVVWVSVAGKGELCFVYARDPEGNILEIQRWSGRHA